MTATNLVTETKDPSGDKPKKKFSHKRKRALKKSYKAKHETAKTIKVRYKPQDKQKLFADMIEEGKKIVVFYSGRQYGKTFAGGFESVKQIYKYCRKPHLGWIVAPTYPMSLVAEQSFEEAAGWYENGGLILRKLRGERAYIMHPPAGSNEPFRVEVKTTEHPDRLRGSRVGFIWMDEAAMMPSEAFKIALACTLATKGIIFLTTTPRGKNWVYDLCQQAETNSRIGAVRARSADAEHITKEELALLEGQYSDMFARQELEAEFVSFDGLVYKNFDLDYHVIPPMGKLPEGASLVGGIDNGYADPFVHLWIVKHREAYYVVDEYYEKGRTTEYVSRAIKSNKWDRHVSRRWADPSGAQERADLDRYGIGTHPARNDIMAGINEVARLIDNKRLYITQNCVHTIKEISQYHYEEKTERNRGEKPVDFSNHAMDALRYAIISECQYQPINPYVEQQDDGSLLVHDGPVNFLSNNLDDWLRFDAALQDAYSDETM